MTDPSLSIPLSDELLDALADRVAERLNGAGTHEGWVGVEEAADHLACRPRRIYDLVHRKDAGLPHRKEGTRLLFRLTELDRYIENGVGT